MDGRSLSGYQQKRVWLNDGSGKFVNVAQAVGATDSYDGRSVALVDLWNRGVLDVIVANQRGPVLIYKNTRSSGESVDRLRTGGDSQQPQRDRGRGRFVLEWTETSAAGFWRQRLLCSESAPAAFRNRQESAN